MPIGKSDYIQALKKSVASKSFQPLMKRFC